MFLSFPFIYSTYFFVKDKNVKKNKEISKTNRQSWLEQKITQPTLGRISSIQRALLTDKNPVFLATNFLKDIGDAPLNSKYGTAEFFKNYGVAMNEMRKGTKSKLWQLYLANGGLQNSYFENKRKS